MVIEPAFITKLPPLLVVKLAKASTKPTLLLKVVTPVLLMVKACVVLAAESTVLLRLIAPVPALKEVLAFKVIAVLPKEIPALLVLITPPMLIVFAAVAVKPPAKLKVSVAALPNTTLPVFKRVVLPFTLVLLPNNSK